VRPVAPLSAHARKRSRIRSLGPTSAPLVDEVVGHRGYRLRLGRRRRRKWKFFPLVNNFDPVANDFVPGIADFFASTAGRENFRKQMLDFLATDKYRGVMIDFESFPRSAQANYNTLLTELGGDLHARGMKALYGGARAR